MKIVAANSGIEEADCAPEVVLMVECPAIAGAEYFEVSSRVSDACTAGPNTEPNSYGSRVDELEVGEKASSGTVGDPNAENVSAVTVVVCETGTGTEVTKKGSLKSCALGCTEAAELKDGCATRAADHVYN